jgi:hypothetical protein
MEQTSHNRVIGGSRLGSCNRLNAAGANTPFLGLVYLIRNQHCHIYPFAFAEVAAEANTLTLEICLMAGASLQTSR